jgi:hypothetical protein
MKVAVLCEFSGIVRDAFRNQGHEAISCDLLPTQSPGPHVQGDCFNYDWSDYDLLICHPPCTYLCNSGVRWLIDNPTRKNSMIEAAIFFKKLLEYNVPRICIENPIPHHYALEIIGIKYTQIVQPWQFGHGETKATCLWLKGLPKLTPTNVVNGREPKVHMTPPSKDRWKIRSLTYTGIAEAMATQWSNL